MGAFFHHLAGLPSPHPIAQLWLGLECFPMITDFRALRGKILRNQADG
jgi:hypothetical protein